MKVFISYCGDSKRLAEQLTERMVQSNIDAWTYSDPYYKYGSNAWKEIYREILVREWMIVLNTECTTKSTNQKNEWKHALKNGNMVFAFSKVGVKRPKDLSPRNEGYFDENDFDAKCEKLIKDLKEEETIRQLVRQQKLDSERGDNLKELEKLKTLIRQNTEGLNINKVKEARKLITDRYNERTIIRHIAKIGLAADRDIKDLQAKYVWLQDDLARFKRTDVHYEMLWKQIADAIVTGERKYLRQFLLEKITSRNAISTLDILKPDFSLIERETDSLYSKGYTPSVILSPIQVFMSFINFFRSRITWQATKEQQLTLSDRLPLTIYWSHGKLPSQEFIVLDKNAIRWRVRPDDEDGALATAIGLSPLYKDKVDFLSYTSFKIEILKPEAISVIALPK